VIKFIFPVTMPFSYGAIQPIINHLSLYIIFTIHIFTQDVGGSIVPTGLRQVGQFLCSDQSSQFPRHSG
jgi:hypothetical protein